MKRKFFVTFLVLTLITICTALTSNMHEIEIEAYASNEDNLEQNVEYLALKEYIKKYVSDIPALQQDLAINYFITYRPMAYVKEIIWHCKKKQQDQWYGKATVLLSSGETYTGLNELIYDIGNPIVYIEFIPVISTKNLSDPNLLQQVEMYLPLESVFVPKLYGKIRDIGLEITSNKEKADIYIEFKTVADVYFSNGFSMTLSSQLKIIDNLTEKIFSQTGCMLEPYFFKANPSFFLDEMSTKIIEDVNFKSYPKLIQFLTDKYNREKTLILIDFTPNQIQEISQFLKDNLPLITLMKEKYITVENNTRKQLYDIYYFGSINKLLKVLEKEYTIQQIKMNEITIETISCIFKFKNCETETFKKIRNYFDEKKYEYKLESYKEKELVLKTKQIDDIFEFALAISEELSLIIYEIDEKSAIFE